MEVRKMEVRKMEVTKARPGQPDEKAPPRRFANIER